MENLNKNKPVKAHNIVKILGVHLSSTSLESVLSLIETNLKSGKKTLLVTPNPEFLVYAQKNPWFRDILNSATLAVPDGVGLLWASRFLGTRPLIRQKVTGADLVTGLLEKSTRNGWRIGVVGARKGDLGQIEILIERLKERYPGLKIQCLELMKNQPSRPWEIILAAQGMGNQEKWIKDNFNKTKAVIFIGIGGSLDFLGGFSTRAPKLIRNLGLEWLWRLKEKPHHHFRRAIIACVIFPLLVIKEKLK